MYLYDELFRYPAVTELFSDDAIFQSMLDFEAALARAGVAAGLIPATAAQLIAEKCVSNLFDEESLAAGAALAGNLAIPLVKHLKSLVAAENQDAANYVHLGATSQDVIDTAMVAQLSKALIFVGKDLRRLCNVLAELADQHRATAIVGRTWLQHAVPTTLGAKFAGWLDVLTRHDERLLQSQGLCFTLQFGGAVGTLASLGPRAQSVCDALSKELTFLQPEIPWHTHRDHFAGLATTLGLLTGTLGKIARDIALHSQTEIDELREPAEENRGGSSTMPHKRNPVACAAILAAATRVPGLVSTMLTAMVQEDERGLGNWPAEWETLPEIVMLTAGALHQLTELVPRLEINSDQMCKNLELTGGLIYSEALTTALAAKIGHAEARQRIDAATQQTTKDRLHLRKIVEQDKNLSQHFSAPELDQLFDPHNYTGMANIFIDRVIAQHKTNIALPPLQKK